MDGLVCYKADSLKKACFQHLSRVTFCCVGSYLYGLSIGRVIVLKRDVLML